MIYFKNWSCGSLLKRMFYAIDESCEGGESETQSRLFNLELSLYLPLVGTWGIVKIQNLVKTITAAALFSIRTVNDLRQCSLKYIFNTASCWILLLPCLRMFCWNRVGDQIVYFEGNWLERSASEKLDHARHKYFVPLQASASTKQPSKKGLFVVHKIMRQCHAYIF